MVTVDEALYDLAVRVGQALKTRGLQLVTAESCTGGWIAEAITMVPGSSEWYERGFITYTNTAKMQMLGVLGTTLATHGAVSEQTVKEMVAGALEHSPGNVAVSVSGVAGPGGGTPQKPVGIVCFAWALRDGPLVAATHHFDGDREQVRRQAVVRALEGVLSLVPG
jgi:nicotinamide-nucleotide amidase